MKSCTHAYFGLLSTLFISLTSFASTKVTGTSIKNVFALETPSAATPLLYRGRQPETSQNYKDFGKLKIKNIVIFKIDTDGAIEKEKTVLRQMGYHEKNGNLLHFSFPWDNLTDFKGTCSMALSALQYFEAQIKQDNPTYFHCTVGEDRTGYLAGLYLLYSGQTKDVRKIFDGEMCARGYEAGNSHKPANVVTKIRAQLTPHFLKMSALILDAQERQTRLTVADCAQEPNTLLLQKYQIDEASKFVCKNPLAKK